MRPLSSRQKLFLACALAVAVVALGVVAFWPRELVYEGRPLSYWLDQLPETMITPPGGSSQSTLQHGTLLFDVKSRTLYQLKREDDTNKARLAVAAVGARCLPVLLQRLQTKNTSFTDFEESLSRWVVRFHFSSQAWHSMATRKRGRPSQD